MTARWSSKARRRFSRPRQAGHADHCADLNPLLRARHLSQHPPPPLPLYALPGALEAVLALDGSMLTDDWTRHDLHAGAELAIGPFDVVTADLPHFVSNLGVPLSAGGASVAYTGDCGQCPAAAAHPPMARH